MHFGVARAEEDLEEWQQRRSSRGPLRLVAEEEQEEQEEQERTEEAQQSKDVASIDELVTGVRTQAKEEHPEQVMAGYDHSRQHPDGEHPLYGSNAGGRDMYAERGQEERMEHTYHHSHERHHHDISGDYHP